jgi:hypothetical protein
MLEADHGFDDGSTGHLALSASGPKSGRIGFDEGQAIARAQQGAVAAAARSSASRSPASPPNPSRGLDDLRSCEEVERRIWRAGDR